MLVRKFGALNASDRLIVAEAATLLTLVWFGLRVLPFGTVRQLMTAPRTRPARETCKGNERVAWAVTAAAARMGRPTCLVKAVAAAAMLRRRGCVAEVRFGVRRPAGSSRLEGHAWVECGGRVVVGRVPDSSEYTPLPLPH